MNTDEVLKEWSPSSKCPGWFAQLGQGDHIRFKGPDSDRYRWNPLSALAHHHHRGSHPNVGSSGGNTGLGAR